MTNIIGFGDRSRHQEDSVIQEALSIMESRYRQGSDDHQVFTSPVLVRNYLSLKMADYEREVFAVLLLDSQHRLIECDELFQGTIDTASVYPREVVKLTLKYNAAAVILAHNHPSGLSEPSESDRRVTARLVNALATIDVPVLDHLVVGKNEVTSLAERGLL